MLKSLRNASHSIVIKILFGAIILSFCLWGVGDIFRNYSASRTVINVAKTKIPADAFLREYNNEKQRIKNNSDNPLKDIKNVDIKGVVIENMVNRAVFEQFLRRLKIVVPKKSILNIVQSLPDFQVNGIFNERVYESALKRSGIGEAGFLAQIRDSLERTQLLHPIATSYRIPLFIKEQIAKEFEAEKTLLISILHTKDMQVDKDPSPKETKQYFDSSPEKYKIPEQRDLAILVIDFRSLAKDILRVDPKEVEARFPQTEQSYVQKETRDVQRFSFDTKEDADRDRSLINSGEPLTVIKKKFAIPCEVMKGVRPSDFPDQVGTDLFKLPLNKASPVYQEGGRFYIYRPVKINTSKQLDDKEIKSNILKEIQNEKMNSIEFHKTVKLIKNKVDDGFGSGKGIDEIAKETGLRIEELKAFEKDINAPKLVTIINDEATRKELIEEAFGANKKQATQILESKEDDSIAYVIYVRDIKKSEMPKFETISGKVKNDYINHRKEKEIESQTREIVNKGDEAAAAVAQHKNVMRFKFSKKDLIMAAQGQVAKEDVKKILKIIPNPNVVFNIMSTLRKGEAINYKLPEGERYAIIAFKDASVGVNATDEMGKIISNHVDSGASSDVLPFTMIALKKPLDVEIDEEIVAELIHSTDKADEES
ncbi:MAG: peptidylprolyl isomerase [Holosporales bacterium]|jgi:peptidyl-prolyl cis-trans isomerase D|nr:peptidylprolyl isomerase [Holosporales bacterium]